MKLVIGILSTILMVILLVSASQSETITTPNLLSNNFLDGSWSGDTSSNHGSDTIAGVDKQSVSSTISVIDDGQLYQFEMNQGFTSTQSAEVWFWNSAEQSMTMSQTIVGDSGSTISQSLQIEGTCVDFNGCDYQDTGTNTIVIGSNLETDYDITSTFNFSVPAYPNTHMGADLKNPSLTLSFTLPDFVEDFEAVNDWEEIEFKEEEIWAEEIFEQFYIDEEEFFFTSPSMSFDNYTMEYEDEAIKEMDMEFEYEVFNYESEQPFEETPMMYEEVFTEEMFEDTPPKEMEEEEAVVPEEMLLEEPQENKEAEEEKELELENFSSEEAPEKLEPVLNSSDIKNKITIDHVVVKTKIDMLKFEDALKVSLMLEAQPILVDTVFYPSVNLYPNQLSISDNRVIYKDVQFIANDPLLVYETKLRDNRHGQYILRKQLESMKWVN